MKRVWFTSLNDYLKHIAEFIREVRFVLFSYIVKEGFSKHTVLSWDASIGLLFAGFLRLYIGWEMPRSGCYWMKDVIMYGGLNQSVGRSSGNGG